MKHLDSNGRVAVPARLGRLLSGSKNRGILDALRKVVHKLSGAPHDILAIQAFARDKVDLTVYIQMDCVTALPYFKMRGGCHSPPLMQLARKVWGWCVERWIISLQVRTQQTYLIFGSTSMEAPSLYLVLLSILREYLHLIPSQESTILQVQTIPPPIRGQEVQLAMTYLRKKPFKEGYKAPLCIMAYRVSGQLQLTLSQVGVLA